MTTEGLAKKIVLYDAGSLIVPSMGKQAVLRVHLEKTVTITKEVWRYDPCSGAVETEDTIYLPWKKELTE